MSHPDIDKALPDLLATLGLLQRLVRQGWRRTRSTGLAFAHYHALGFLLRSGPLPVSELGRALCISKPNMTPLIDRLVEKGLATRVPEPGDRRVIRVAPTEKGRTLMGEGRRRMTGNLKEIFSELTAQEQENLIDALHTARTLLAKIPLGEKP
jgi:DNA-binding MarR family transcriptional regulator